MDKGTLTAEQRELRLKELAVKLSAVLNDSELPDEIEERIGEGLNNLFNDLGKGAWKKVEYSPEYIALLLKANAEV